MEIAVQSDRYFLNLTNGIEVPGLIEPNNPYYFPVPVRSYPWQFVRIESTALEQKLLSKVIEELDYGFLLPVFHGHKVVVFDCSSKKKESRAIFEGLPWIKYCVGRTLFTPEKAAELAIVKRLNVAPYFAGQYEKLSARAQGKLRYCGKMCGGVEWPRLEGICYPSSMDSDYAWFKKELEILLGEVKQ